VPVSPLTTGYGWTERVAQKGRRFRLETDSEIYIGEFGKPTIRVDRAKAMY